MTVWAPPTIGGPIVGSTSGSILFADSNSNFAQDNTGLFFDATNHRLGVGTTAPFCRIANVSTDVQDASGEGVATSGFLWSVGTGAAGKYAAVIENHNTTFSNPGGLLVRTSIADAVNPVLTCNGGGTDIFLMHGDGSTAMTGPLTLATHIGGTGTTSPLTLRSTSGVGAAGADIIFQVGNNGATEAMRILNNGNVGIGVSPTRKLDVYNASTDTTIGITGSTTLGAAGVADINFYNVGADSGTTRLAAMQVTSGNNTKNVGHLNLYVKKLAADANPTAVLGIAYDGTMRQNGSSMGMYTQDLTGVANGGNALVRGSYPTGIAICFVYNNDGFHREALIAVGVQGLSKISDPTGLWEVNTTTPAANHTSLNYDAASGNLTFYNNSNATITQGGVTLIGSLNY